MSMQSTRSTFDRALVTIRDDIVRMGSLVEAAVDRAFTSFQTHDGDLAHAVIAEDKVINDLRYKAEQEITSTMALQQPMAHDLRVLLASLIIANELERMGDHGEGIARTVDRHILEPITDIPPQLIDMADHVREMIRQSMDAFLSEDVERARATAQMDDRIDMLYQSLFTWVVEQMGTGALSVRHGTFLLWTGHNLERIGDRATNICERVIFTSTGEIGRGMNPKQGEM